MRIITLGDNITSSPSWADYLSKKLNCELLNFAKGESTNEEQIFSMQDFLFENDLDFEDIIIWQLSAFKKLGIHVGPTLDDTIIDSSKYYNFLAYQKKNNYDDSSLNEEENLSQILSMLITIRKWTDRILVFRSYREIISSNNTKLFSNDLRKNRIEFVSESIIDWCYEQNLFFKTNGVPAYDAQTKFCDKIIMPKLNLMKWSS